MQKFFGEILLIYDDRENDYHKGFDDMEYRGFENIIYKKKRKQAIKYSS